ncbi:hypothetical protein VTL71DRAFT_8547, partial [Oculimacula yallundae]
MKVKKLPQTVNSITVHEAMSYSGFRTLVITCLRVMGCSSDFKSNRYGKLLGLQYGPEELVAVRAQPQEAGAGVSSTISNLNYCQNGRPPQPP